MHEILDEFEHCPERIINLKVSSPVLLKTSLLDFVISITHSVLIRSTWVGEVDMDGISNKFETWQNIVCLRGTSLDC